MIGEFEINSKWHIILQVLPRLSRVFLDVIIFFHYICHITRFLFYYRRHYLFMLSENTTLLSLPFVLLSFRKSYLQRLRCDAHATSRVTRLIFGLYYISREAVALLAQYWFNITIYHYRVPYYIHINIIDRFHRYEKNTGQFPPWYDISSLIVSVVMVTTKMPAAALLFIEMRFDAYY